MKTYLSAAAAMLVLFASSCKKDNSDCTPAVIHVVESINTATTWDACHIYHITAQVVVKATLTIEPGTIIKLDDNQTITVTDGKIIADGTAENPIVFTSWKDDTQGGDNNLDGSATTPQAGDWKQINLTHSSDNTFNHCKIMYGGKNSTPYWSVTLAWGDGANNRLTNSVIARNFGEAAQSAGAVDMTQSPSTTVVTGNTFYGNFRPIAISNVISIDESNVFHNPDNANEINVANGIFVHVYFTSLASIPDVNFYETEVPFVFASDNSYTLPFPRQINLTIGVVVKFGDSFSLNISNESQLNNHTATGVYFCSLKNDGRLGDTNGDGNATAAGGTDWDGIWEIPTGNYFAWGNIENAN
jgi:hypothetical protein